MMHISLTRYIFIQAIHSLNFRQRRQRAHITDLCLTTREHSRTVYSRNNIHFRRKGPDLIQCPAVRTLMIFQDHLAHRFLLILVYRLTQHRKIFFVLRKCLLQLSRDISDILLTHLLLIREDSCLHLLRCYDLLHILEHLLRNRTTFIGMLRLTHFRNDLIDKFNDRLIHLMCFIDRLQHSVFRHFIRTRLYHHHFLCRRSNRHLQIAFIPLLLGRIHDQLSVHHSHLRHCTGSVERDI